MRDLVNKHVVVISHKLCWYDDDGQVRTRGGFPYQMQALANVYGSVTLVVPVLKDGEERVGSVVTSSNVDVIPLEPIMVRGLLRKWFLVLWCFRGIGVIRRAIRNAHIVHVPLPSDIGSIGVAVALIARQRLLIRYCGQWDSPSSAVQRAWMLFAKYYRSGSVLFLATGEDDLPPSRLSHLHWIFSTGMTENQGTRYGSVRRLRSDEPIRIITVGRLEGKKGTAEAISALVQLQERHGRRATLDVIGSGGEMPVLRRLASDYGVADSVVFHGELSHDEVLQRLEASHVFCLPSRSEGFPKAVVEALTCGLPCVTSSVSVLPRLLREGGGMVTDGSIDSIVEGILNLTNDAGVYEQHSQRALEIGKRYTLEKWAAQIYKLTPGDWL